MMYDVEDLKSRALVESNILKQFILSANAKKRGEFKPRLDDILIHDYQMANSVTLNVILSNYMVDLAYAVDCIENPLYGGSRDSYFKLVRGLDMENPNLDDQTRLVLDVSDGNGSFKTRDLVLDLKQVWDSHQKVTKFINLDSIWYCRKVEKKNVGGRVLEYDTLEIVKEMNKFDVGSNPFDKPLFDKSGNEINSGFNNWMGDLDNGSLNCIIENRFYKNTMKDEGAEHKKTDFADSLTKCKYLFCVPSGFFGLENHYDSTTRTFDGFVLHDIGGGLPILQNTFNYKFCSFHVIGSGDESTLFLTIYETSSTRHPEKYHYLFVNESSLDETYGFTEIDSVLVDQLVVPPSNVFSWVDQIRELDTVNIAMTDYGFWDLEDNNTNNVQYSYRGGKEFNGGVPSFNDDISKLITPTMDFNSATQKAVEYSSLESEGYVTDEQGNKVGVDRIWSPVGDYWYKCEGIVFDGEAKMYRSKIYPNDVELPFVGGTENFAVYDHSGDDPIHILVNLTREQFVNLLFANSQLTTYFIEWLYDQVVEGPLAVNGSTIHSGKGEYYLWNNNGSFIGNLERSLSNNEFDGLQLQLGKKYPETGTQQIKLDLDGKFESVEKLVKAYDSSVSSLTQYCTSLYNIGNAPYNTGSGTKKIDVGWLVNNRGDGTGEAAIKTNMGDLFGKVTWETKRETFVKKVLDTLVKEDAFPLLRYFRDYLDCHLNHDTSDFFAALKSGTTPQIDFVSGEQQRVVNAVQEYIKSKVNTSLVLGGYSEQDKQGNSLVGNDRYPGIDKYLYQNQRKMNKVQARDIMSIANTLKEVMFAVQSTKFINGCDSFDELKTSKDSRDLFTMTQNSQFAALSKLVDNRYVDTLNVNWSSVKDWLFGNNPNKCTDELMLKAFVRTQIYRPLFFKHDNYTKFTSSTATYSCDTDKYYIDHFGNERQIVFVAGTLETTNPEVKKHESGLDDVANVYTIEDISFYKISNKFEYFIHYSPVKVIGTQDDSKEKDTFVVNDVEYYVVRPEGNVVKSIYFNEFQNNTEGQNQVSKVVYDTTSEKYKFKLNGIEYVIEGNEISIDQATDEFSGNEVEWKCEIVDDRFCFDGTWYLLERNSQSEYAYVKYADNKDNKLISIDVTPDGYAEYKPWGITFQFDAATWNSVQVVKKCQCDVIDKLREESCRYDTKTIDFSDTNKTYDWYLANEILRIQREHQSQEQALLNLGGGNIYNGALKLTTNETLGTVCGIRIRNVVQNEDVITICELVKKYGENDLVQQMGTLFDRDLKLDSDRVFRGAMSEDGLVSKSDSGQYAVFVKDFGKGLNNVNVALVEYSIWDGTHRVVSGVGTFD